MSLSLGLGISDINNDGWQDIFVGNDFNESDYLFLNNGNGTFTESSKVTFDHTSMFSMGCDIADINNDGHMDLVSLDMLPESNYLQKLHSGADNYNKISTMISNGFQPQFSKNVLQINNGDGSFSECAQMYGVSNTDWSWASLFIDFDQDSYLDLFISNGYLRDHTDMDFLQFTADQVVKADKGENPVSFEKYMASMPPINQPNYFFHNEHGKKFVNKNAAWALTTPTISHGSAYADFDNDGDVDIVTSNVGDYVYLYENNSDHNTNNFINIKLKGSKSNIHAIGTRVTLYCGGQQYIKDLQPCRGFMSTMEYKLFFGLGEKRKIDTIRIDWPDGYVQKQITDQINTTIEVEYDSVKTVPFTPFPKLKPLFVKDSLIQSFYSGIDEFDDFKVQGLLTHYLTDRGPKCLVGDVNGDQLEDFILTGNTVTTSKLYIQHQDGNFTSSDLPVKGLEISDITFIYPKEQPLPDIVLSVGSYKYAPDTKARGIYYLQNDKGLFKKSVFSSTIMTNPASLAVYDINNDGWQDLIVGGTCDYRMYPKSTETLIMKNEGNGQFSIVPQSETNIGLVNDIASLDLDGDQKNEIVIVGDWMPIKVFTIVSGKFKDVSSTFFEKEYKGFWKCIYHSKKENKKDFDLIFGNVGTNSQLFASFDHPMVLFDQDYDQNGSIDPILATFIGDNTYPFAPREDMIKQIPMLNKRFNSFGLYAKADIKTLLGEKYFESAKPLHINTLETSFFNRENGKFVKVNVDEKVQVAPVYNVKQLEADNNMKHDLLLAGNQSKVRVKLGRLNGNHGLMLGHSNDGYNTISQTKSGFDVRGDTRDLAVVKSKKGDLLIFAVYNGNAQFYRRQK
ncbi:MAG: VCBS repeat-containing protein [Saprospiraceae bacterium]|nr:VCBS repeat-containing protein [Saprospiraceae bacterium]